MTILHWIYEMLGLANKKIVTIQSERKDQFNKPSSLLHKSIVRKEFPRMPKFLKLTVLSCNDEAITCKKNLFFGFFYEIYLLPLACELLKFNECNFNVYVASIEQHVLNAVSRSLKVAKSGVNKRNKQASKIRGR
ncbi:hypothetical protein QQP08_026463, partial [Theobroma cacao]